MVCFPPGAGGNFLTARKPEHTELISACNAYVTGAANNLILDDVPFDPSLDLDTLHRHLCLQPPLTNLEKKSVARVHNMPWLSLMVFTMTVDELVVIRVDPTLSWYVHALNRIKWYCNSDWTANPDMIAELLSDAHMPGRVRLHDYQLLIAAIDTAFGVDARGTVISWKHFMRCKTLGLALDDITQFSSHLSEEVFYTLDQLTRGEPNHWHLLWQGPLFEAQLAECKSMVMKLCEIDYGQLMLDGLHRDHGYLSSLSGEDVMQYTQRNCQLIRHWLKACTPAMRDAGMRRLDAIEMRCARGQW